MSSINRNVSPIVFLVIKLQNGINDLDKTFILDNYKERVSLSCLFFPGEIQVVSISR